MVVTGAGCGAGDKTPREPASAVCDVHAGPCRTELSGRVVTLDIVPKPVRVMEDLQFVVTVSGPPLEAPPYIDLNMVAMDMGPNRVEMENPAEGTYAGTGVIVKCPSGKKRWQALVTVPGLGVAEFQFDVQY